MTAFFRIVELYQKQLARSNATKRTPVENFIAFVMRKYGIFRRRLVCVYLHSTNQYDLYILFALRKVMSAAAL